MSWDWWPDGRPRFIGGATKNGKHYAKDYDSTSTYSGWDKIPFAKLSGLPRAVAFYPPKRTIQGVKLSKKEHDFVKLLSCKSRIVFWLYNKFNWPARAISEAYGTAIIDQHEVYIRNRRLKTVIFNIANENKNIDWAEVALLAGEGATPEDIAQFYGLNVNVVKRQLRARSE